MHKHMTMSVRTDDKALDYMLNSAHDVGTSMSALLDLIIDLHGRGGSSCLLQVSLSALRHYVLQIDILPHA